jgi:hypothetical protein
MPPDVAAARLPPSAANCAVVRVAGPPPSRGAPPQLAFSLTIRERVRGRALLSCDWSGVTPPPAVVGPALAAAGPPFPVGYELNGAGRVALVARAEGPRPPPPRLPRSAVGLPVRARPWVLVGFGAGGQSGSELRAPPALRRSCVASP